MTTPTLIDFDWHGRAPQHGDGWVYIGLDHAAGLVKVGYSSSAPDRRCRYQRLELVWAIELPRALYVELLAHRILTDAGLQEGTLEWYKATVDTCIAAVLQARDTLPSKPPYTLGRPSCIA